MYRPLNIKQGKSESFRTSMMPRHGMNKDDFTQVMDTKYAINIVNYIPQRFGLEKRGGLTNLFERAGANPITFLEEYTTGVWIIGYSTKLEAYDTNTKTWTTIKSNFAADSSYDGGRAGDYMLISSDTEKIGRLSMTLAYDAQSANFTPGAILTGGTSGATATILEDNDGGSTGTLTLGNISGTFQDDETITDSGSGSATSNGTLTFAYTTITNAPICGGLKIIGSRAYAFRLKANVAKSQYSEVDDGTNPPFNTWSDTTDADAGGSANYRNAGPIRSIVQLGETTVVFGDKGFLAFQIVTVDSAGTLKKVEVIQNYTEDYGGARGAIETPMGIYYLNEAGLWQMVAVGQTNVPMSRQQVLTSSLLGGDYFKGVDQSNVDIVYDLNQKIVLVAVAKDSPFNNIIVGCKPELKNSMFTFKNWNINRFAKAGTTLYGASSTKTTVYQLFDGYDDDGLNIGTEYYQEVPLGTLFHAHALLGLYAGGFLSASSQIQVRFDIFDRDGNIVYDKEKYLWTANSTSNEFDEWASARLGESGFGGSFDTADLIQSFGGGSPRVNNMQRLRIRVTGEDKLRHILNWLTVKTIQKGAIKRRNISKITT